MKPRIIVLIGAFWPGHESAGPNLSVKAMCETLADSFDFLLVARDRAFGATAPLVASDGWLDLGWAKIRYLPIGPRGATGLARLLRETPHDIVFTNSFFDKEFTIPLLVARRFGKVPRKPVVLSPRGEFSYGALGLKASRKSIYRAAASMLGLVNDVVFHATSDDEVRDVRAAFTANRVVLISNVRPAFPLPPHVRPALGAPLRVAFVGRISPVKGLDVALESLRLARRPVDFTIYGPISDAAHWARCRTIMEALPGHVSARHAGELANCAVPTALAAQDLMFMPSRSENFGHAIFESLCAGTPVMIGGRTPWQGLEAERAGFDLSDMSPAAFATAIDRYAALDADERASWREGARHIAERFARESKAAEELSVLFKGLSSSAWPEAGDR